MNEFTKSATSDLYLAVLVPCLLCFYFDLLLSVQAQAQTIDRGWKRQRRMSGSNGVIDFLVIYGQQAHGGEKSGDRLWGGFGARPRGQAQADTAAIGV